MNLMELCIKIVADDQATSKLGEVAEKANGLASKMGAGLATAAKIGGAAVTATAGGVAMLAKKATDAYSSFEQLKGGVETLFGEASDTVIANAEKAFATSGTSMNQYMETVTSFAASLIQATGRGEQTDLEELETALENRLEATKEALEEEYDARKEAYNDEYKALKQSLNEQYEERKEYWKAVINSAESKEAKEAFKQERDNELKILKKSNSEQLTALKSKNDKELKELKKANKNSLTVTEQANKDRLEQVKALNQQSETTSESLQEAARLADIALQDMSDNANKMGTAMASIQNAYQGFAKANYTMLDNLNTMGALAA